LVVEFIAHKSPPLADKFAQTTKLLNPMAEALSRVIVKQ